MNIFKYVTFARKISNFVLKFICVLLSIGSIKMKLTLCGEKNKYTIIAISMLKRFGVFCLRWHIIKESQHIPDLIKVICRWQICWKQFPSKVGIQSIKEKNNSLVQHSIVFSFLSKWMLNGMENVISVAASCIVSLHHIKRRILLLAVGALLSSSSI